MYGLTIPLLKTKPFDAQHFHILGAAKFIISKKLSKRPPTRGVEKAFADFAAILNQVQVLEPTDDEISLAAELEYLASQSGEQLDGGESLLCAILLLRNRNYIFTGDKRALSAISRLISSDFGEALSGKLICIEQLFKHLIQHIEPKEVRTAVCNEPKVDTALTNCFSCHSQTPSTQSIIDGLDSYIQHIHTNSPGVLINKLD